MAARPPIRSVVVKTPTPTPVQQRLSTAQAQTARSARAQHILATDPQYGGAGDPWSHLRESLARPVATDARGFVKSPIADRTARLAPAKAATPRAKKAPIKVTVHPDGRVEVHHTPLVSTSTASAVPVHTVSAHPVRPTKAAPARTPAGVVSTAPVQTVEQQAQGLLDPVKKAILDAINQRVTAEQGAITGYSKDLAGLMGSYGPASKAAYGNAEVGQAAVDAATGGTLAGQGQAGQAELAAKLAAIDADPATAARINATAGANTAGATGALAARGSSSLSDLISRGASARDYGAKLPGVAGLYGLQATKAAQSKATTDTANAVATLEGQYPSLVTSLKQNQQQQSANETTRALAATQALGAAPPWAAKILGVPPGTPSAAIKAATVKGKAASVAAQAKVDTAARKVNLPLSKTYGILVNANAEPILKNGKVVPVPGQPPSKTQGLSAKDFLKFQSQALGAARNYHGTWSDAKGNQFPPLSWQQYLTHGESAGIPINVLIAEGRKVYSQAEIKRGLIPKG